MHRKGYYYSYNRNFLNHVKGYKEKYALMKLAKVSRAMTSLEKVYTIDSCSASVLLYRTN